MEMEGAMKQNRKSRMSLSSTFIAVFALFFSTQALASSSPAVMDKAAKSDEAPGVQVNVQVSHEGSNTIPTGVSSGEEKKSKKKRWPRNERGAVVVKRSTPVDDGGRAQASHRIFQYMPDSSKSYGTESMLAELSKEVAGKVFYELKEGGQRKLTSRVAIVAAVPLSDLKRETEFGRVIAEYYLTDLADRGINVKELRLGKDINILPQTGEFILSRNIGEIASNSPALDYVVVSTFTNTRKTLILQGRLVSLKTGLIKTSWRYNLPINRELLGLFYSIDQPFTIAVKGMGQ